LRKADDDLFSIAKDRSTVARYVTDGKGVRYSTTERVDGIEDPCGWVALAADFDVTGNGACSIGNRHEKLGDVVTVFVQSMDVQLSGGADIGIVQLDPT
jgi:hypothetical protein